MIWSAMLWKSTPGKSIARLSGDLTGLRYPSKRIIATQPYALLHESWFNTEHWVEVTRGRWVFGDGIILGESRAVTKIVDILSVFKEARSYKFLELQDNSLVVGLLRKVGLQHKPSTNHS